jgi:hypothetical protein
VPQFQIHTSRALKMGGLNLAKQVETEVAGLEVEKAATYFENVLLSSKMEKCQIPIGELFLILRQFYIRISEKLRRCRPLRK